MGDQLLWSVKNRDRDTLEECIKKVARWSNYIPSLLPPSLSHSLPPSLQQFPCYGLTHIHHITPNDAHRLLHVAALSGQSHLLTGHYTVQDTHYQDTSPPSPLTGRPSVSGMTSSARRRWSRRHLSTSRSAIFNAIMTRHNSYEVLE